MITKIFDFRLKTYDSVIKSRKSATRNSRGVTLIELTVVTAVTGLLIVLIMGFLTDKYAENAIKNAEADLQLQTQLTLDLMNYDIKYAAILDGNNRWADQYAPGSPDDNYSWVSDEDVLILAAPAQDTSKEILYEDPQAYVSYKDNLIYYVSDGTLYRRRIAADVPNNSATTTCPPETSGCPSDSILAQNVLNFTLTYYDAFDNEIPPSEILNPEPVTNEIRSVRVSLQLQKQLFGKTLASDQSIRAVFRNE